jgi:hypothetical protein
VFINSRFWIQSAPFSIVRPCQRIRSTPRSCGYFVPCYVWSLRT